MLHCNKMKTTNFLAHLLVNLFILPVPFNQVSWQDLWKVLLQHNADHVSDCDIFHHSFFSVFHVNIPRLVSHQEHNVLAGLLKSKELIPIYLNFHVSGAWPAALGSKQPLVGDDVLCVLETSRPPAALDEKPKLPKQKKDHSPVTTFGYILCNSCS